MNRTYLLTYILLSFFLFACDSISSKFSATDESSISKYAIIFDKSSLSLNRVEITEGSAVVLIVNIYPTRDKKTELDVVLTSANNNVSSRFQSYNSKLTIAAGSNSAMLNLTSIDDGTYQGAPEDFTLSLSTTEAKLDVSDANITIRLDDNDASMGAFTISGITANSGDSTVDAVLSNSLTPKINFTASTLATSYDIVIYQNDGVTVACPLQNTSSLAYVMTGCNLTGGQNYKASVKSRLSSSELAATNNMYSFNVNRSPVAGSSPSGVGPWYVMQGGSITINAAWAASPSVGVATDPDGDSFTFTAVGTGVLGTATNNNSNIQFTAGASAAGKETLSFTITDSRGGILTGNIIIHVMTAMTWTGGSSNTWSSGTAANWCNTVNANKTGCTGSGTVPAGSDTARIDDTCQGSNCSPTTNYNVSVAGLKIGGSTLNQGTGFTITVGTTGLVQTAGTFNGSNATIQVNSTTTLSGGTFNSTSGNLLLYNFSSTPGTYNLLSFGGTSVFNHNSGTVEVQPIRNGCVASYFQINLTQALSLNNFRINSASNGCGVSQTVLVATAGSDLTILGSINYVAGGFGGTGVIHLKGDINILGTAAMAAYGGSTVIVDGTGNQYYSSVASGATASYLTVNKASGTFTAAAGTTDFQAQNLRVMQGTFTAPTGTLKLTDMAFGTIDAFRVAAGASFIHNSGTVELAFAKPACGSSDYQVYFGQAQTLNNLSIAGYTNGCGHIGPNFLSTSSPLTVLGNLNHSGGFIFGSGVINLYGDLNISGTAYGGSNTIYMNGSSNQLYSSTSGSPFTANVVVNKLSGSVGPAMGTTDLTLHTLSILQGSFTAPSGTLRFYLQGDTTYEVLKVATGASLAHNSGTVEFSVSSAGCVGTDFQVIFGQAQTLNNLSLASFDGGCGFRGPNFTGSNDVTFLGNLNMSAGYLLGVAPIHLKGDLNLSSNSSGGSAVVRLDGTADQYYSSTSLTPRAPFIFIDKASGNVLPAGGTTDIYLSSLVVNQGSFTAPTGTLQLGTIELTSTIDLFKVATGATFIHNSGTVNLVPGKNGCASPDFRISFGQAQSLQNLTLNTPIYGCGVGPVNFVASSTLTVLGQTNLNAGYLVGNGTLNLEGDLTYGALYAGGSQPINLTGGNVQALNSSGNLPTGLFTINKSGGSVDFGTAITFNGGVDLTAGTVNMQNHNLTTPGNLSLSVGTVINRGGGTISSGSLSNSGTIN